MWPRVLLADAHFDALRRCTREVPRCRRHRWTRPNRRVRSLEVERAAETQERRRCPRSVRVPKSDSFPSSFVQFSSAYTHRREAEKEEIEARRAMPEHLRLKEDTERADASRQRARGGQAFLSKYHHAGVFYSEDQRTQELMERERRNKVEMQDQVLDMASLPKMMQVRDFGKRSRTKHTHLRDVDTTKQDAGWARGGGSGGNNACFHCGEPGHVRSFGS